MGPAAEAPAPANRGLAAAGEDETGHCSVAAGAVGLAASVGLAGTVGPVEGASLASEAPAEVASPVPEAEHQGSGGRRPEAVARAGARGCPGARSAASRGPVRGPPDPTYIVLLRMELPHCQVYGPMLTPGPEWCFRPATVPDIRWPTQVRCHVDESLSPGPPRRGRAAMKSPVTRQISTTPIVTWNDACLLERSTVHTRTAVDVDSCSFSCGWCRVNSQADFLLWSGSTRSS